MLKILIPNRKGTAAVAAAEFASLWLRITGEKPAVTTRDDRRSDLVVLGSDAINAFTHAKIVERVIPDFALVAGSDSYHLRSAVAADGRQLLFIAGGRPRALLYGVYRFFELRADCRYFWDGDIVPPGPAPDLAGLDLRESPRFRYRGLRYFAHRSLTRFQAEQWDFPEWKREIDWILKKRMNLFMLRIGLDDLFQRAFPETVPYPKGYEIEGAKPRSYDDRTLFWSLRYRAELRKKVLAYARERDLMHPEDIGTMTHWYSRTPQAYLDRVNPDFLPQSTSGYGEKSGLVWDIRKEKHLDAYWRLTEAHLREYGSPELFHTIGLAERRCYADRDANHQMKLYTYRRIQKKLREHYPNAPLLIASWDFAMYWHPEEVEQLVAELDPERTLILDYTSDTDDEARNVEHWGLVGKFPWIFGIFHAYEPESEPRGNYDAIARRLPVAAADPMCRGMIYWPENSHTDTLMLEFFAANAWDPSPANIDIDSFVGTFCTMRYGEAERAAMTELWRLALPLLKARHWNGPARLQERDNREKLFGEFFFRAPTSLQRALIPEGRRQAEFFAETLVPVAARAAEVVRRIAAMAPERASGFLRRDLFDLLRTAGSRALGGAFARLMLALAGNDDDATEAAFALALDAERAFGRVLAAEPEYSLAASLRELRAKHRTNPNFESTLKGNSENHYCRAFIAEFFPALYIPELAACRDIRRRARHAGTAPVFADAPEIAAIRDDFYATPLERFAPDFAAAERDLPAALAQLAKIMTRIASNS